MPNNYRGLPGNITGNLPGILSISSSTNASPIQITTTAIHTLTTGDIVNVYGHHTNTAANGQWTITVTGTTNFTLNGSTGNGVGGNTGNVQGIVLPNYQQPSDGDPLNASSANTPIDALGDRSSWLTTVTGSYKWRALGAVSPQRGYIVHEDAFAGGAWGNCTIGSTLTQTAFSGSTLPIQLTGDATSADLVEVQLDSTLVWGGSASPANGVFISLFFAVQSPGGAIGAYAKILGSSKFFLPVTPSSSQYIPFTLRGYILAPTAPIIWLLPYGYVASGGATGSVNTYTDYLVTCRHWRATQVPQ